MRARVRGAFRVVLVGFSCCGFLVGKKRTAYLVPAARNCRGRLGLYVEVAGWVVVGVVWSGLLVGLLGGEQVSQHERGGRPGGSRRE